MTQALLSIVIDRVIEDEGDFVSDANDRGGATKFGLTMPFLATVTGRQWSLEELRQMSIDRARAIYRLWMEMRRLDQLPEHLPLAWAVIDFAVHSGERPAIRALQAFMGVPADGIAGAETQGAWHLLSPEACEKARLAVVAARAERIGDALSHPGQSVFARGWLRRLAKQIRG